jgi:hypothetical protein
VGQRIRQVLLTPKLFSQMSCYGLMVCSWCGGTLKVGDEVLSRARHPRNSSWETHKCMGVKRYHLSCWERLLR